MTDRSQSPSTPRRLTIRALATISIRAPLVRTYRGSHNRPLLRAGLLQLSEQPEFGWEPDGEFIERYRASDEDE